MNFPRPPPLAAFEAHDGMGCDMYSPIDNAGAYYTVGPPSSHSINPLPVDALAHPTRLTDMYRRDDARQQMWAGPPEVEPYSYQMLPPFQPSSSITFSAGLQLHAPIPLAGPSSLLFTDIENSNFPALSGSQPLHHSDAQLKIITDSVPNSMHGHQERIDNLNSYAIIEPPQQTFPTPSELLTELAAANPPDPGTGEPALQRPTDSARKARRRAMMKSTIGFAPTDPDTISSHEKKRHYLECLEHYVVYLHEQLSLIGAEPVPLERVSNYRGLSSRSIRTLLVHMENSTRKLNNRTVSEEQRFLVLRDAVVQQENPQIAGAAPDARHQAAVDSNSSLSGDMLRYPQ